MREIHGRRLGHPTGRDGVDETVTNPEIGVQAVFRAHLTIHGWLLEQHNPRTQNH